MSRLALLCSVLCVALFLPALGFAQDEEGAAPGPELTGKELNEAIRALDRSDPVVGYARAMRRDGTLFVVGGGALAGLSVGIAAIEALVGGSGPSGGPYVASIGVPFGLGLLITGLPSMILAPQYLGWYANRGPAPSNLARLRLMHRWRSEWLRYQRDASLLGGAFLGGAGLLSSVVWAVRDAQGHNGTPGTAGYAPIDAIASISFFAAAGALTGAGLYFMDLHRQESRTPHRLLAMPTMSVQPALAGGRGTGRPEGLALQVGLLGRF